MKCNLPPEVVGTRGITLVELTVAIVVILSLISLLAIGTRGWMRASARSACIMNLRNFQVATRSYQNLYGYYPGGHPKLEYGTQDIARHLFEKEYVSPSLYDQAKGAKACAGGGTYISSEPDVFPLPGNLYLICSLVVSRKHMPEDAAEW